MPLRLLPRRIYYGVVGNQKRYFALKLPLAVDPETVTFAYVDPGHQTDRELYSWGAAHGPLWDALRKKGRQVRVIGIAAENLILDRTRRVLERWAAAEPGKPSEGRTLQQEIKRIDTALRTNDETVLAEYGGFNGAMKRGAELERWAAADPGTSDEVLTAKREIKAIDEAMTHKDREFLARYGGFGGAMKRSAYLQKLPEAKLTEGVSIDDYSTYRATRFADPNEIG